MLDATKTEALEFLRGFAFNVRTDMSKKRINNRDAMAFLFFRCGPMRLTEIRNLMMMWRLGEAQYVIRPVYHYTRNEDGDFIKKTRRSPSMSFSYAFNTSHSGG